jgi:arylsulfatase A-like enzyme
MKNPASRDWPAALFLSVIYGILAIPAEFLILPKVTSAGWLGALLASLRCCGMVSLTVGLFSAIVLAGLNVTQRIRRQPLKTPFRQAILVASGPAVLSFLWIFDQFDDKFRALVAGEVLGGAFAVFVVWIAFAVVRSGRRSKGLELLNPKLTFLGILVVVLLSGIGAVGPGGFRYKENPETPARRPSRPNILLIVMDAVRADHLSLYGYHHPTTPFLEKMATESVVFENAFAAAPWTLPSHASLFTGFYPSQHQAHAEHMWLDDSFRTLAEALHDNGYQTICFSNNDYVSSYHNLVQGFERTWYKRDWTDVHRFHSYGLGRPIVSFWSWLSGDVGKRILAKIARIPTSLRVYPDATVTNKAIVTWLQDDRDANRPFFIFVNYMDAHLPYNPDDRTARLFMDEKDLETSRLQRLRFPPIEYCLDVSRGGYTRPEIQIIRGLYDACIRRLDGELERLFGELRTRGLYDDTLIIITSDHGEYLGERNRFAHGLGLHDEVLHIPLIIRYPPLFPPNTQNNAVVTHVDIPETILSFAGVGDRPQGLPDARRLFEMNRGARPYVFAEFRFPVHLFVNASLREDNSPWCEEQKAIRSATHQLIWKSRGDYEFYDVRTDPLEANNLYSKDQPTAQAMSQELSRWYNSIYVPPLRHAPRDGQERESRELQERLRALGYIR